MSQIDEQLFQDSQSLIEIWESVLEAMDEKNFDIQELSVRTRLTERELEDYLHNYADVKIRTLFKIARAMGKVISVKMEDAP